jgi:hypothetical protein
VHLTPIEYRLLAVLAGNANRVMTNPQLRAVWGPSQAENGHYLRIYMGHLRQKLEADPAQPRYLLTETAVGYRLQMLHYLLRCAWRVPGRPWSAGTCGCSSAGGWPIDWRYCQILRLRIEPDEFERRREARSHAPASSLLYSTEPPGCRIS